MKKQESTEPKIAVADLLKTDDPEEQAELVKQLIQLAQAPVVSLLVSKDFRTGGVSIRMTGGQVSYDALYDLLDQARKLVLQEERKAQAAEKADS